MLDENIEIINPDDKDYYDNKLFKVGIWPGAGYQLATFKVYANYEEEALNLVVANAEINAPGLLMSIQEIEDLIAEDYQEEYNEFISENPESDDFTFATEYLNYIYVDATMEGASQPYFVIGDNLVIEQITDEKEESKTIKKEARLTDYLGIMQIWDLLKQNPETADKEFAIIDNMEIEVGTGDNLVIYKATQNADNEWELTKVDKSLKKENNENSDIVWEHIEDYSQDEIDEIRNILEDLEVEAVKISDHSVAVKIKPNEMIFWLDYAQEGDDIVGDWNQYIFSTINSIDRIRKAVQTSYFKDTGDTFAFDIMESAGLEYLEKNGVVVYTDEGYRFNDNLKENKKLNEKYNQDGFPNNEELEDLFTRQGTLPDEIKIDDRKYAMTEYGGTGENSWVIYSDTDNDDSYIRVYYSMNKLGKDSYQGVKKILGVSDLREAKQIKNEYYVKPDDEHIIWDSEFDLSDYDKEELKEGPYQDYLEDFDDTVVPMSYEEWLDSNECAMYFDDMWTIAAQENDYYAEWYEFITEYVSDDEKEIAYNEYVANCENTKLTPDTFEEWLDNNINQLADDSWELQEEDLEQNILPVIDSQINYDTLILAGYYGSNYPDFRSSGNGGKMFDSVEDFRNYMGDFDRVCITTKNGILGSILNDHDGTVSGQFFTLPENLTELVKAINYEQYIDIPEDITDEDEIFEIVMDQFEEDLVYGGVDIQDLTNHIELLVPIKDTISGYTPDPEPKKESKEKEDPNKYCAICGKEKEDYEASMCDDCWEKEQDRMNKSEKTESIQSTADLVTKSKEAIKNNKDLDTIKVELETAIEKAKQEDDKSSVQLLTPILETIKDKQQDKDIERESKKVEESKNNATFEIDYANDDLTRTYGTRKDIIKSVTRWLGDLAKQVKVNVIVERGPSGGWPVVSLTGNKEKIAKFLLDNFNSGAEETLDEIYDLYLVKENKNVLECNNIKKVEAVEYISKKDYDKLPDDYKTTIGKTLKARQAVGDNIEKLRQLYKDLGYNEDDPMIMTNEKGGTILKPVKVQESKMSEIDIDVKNTLKQFDDYLENEGYDEVDDDVVNEFFTEIFYNIDTEEELEAMNIAEKKIRHKYGLKENKISNKKKIVAKKQRLEIKKENKSNIETVYVPEKDMTIIFEETTDDNDNPTSTEIKGFYYGSPSDDETKKFTGKLKATYDTVQESKTLVEDDTDPEEVANEIQTARENSENDTLSIEQIASSLDVLLVDEQGAIDGYKSYLEQAKQVVSEELYNSIDTQIQEIIKDEEDHIVKLNTIKDTLLGNTDDTPATNTDNTDDILNPETTMEERFLGLSDEVIADSIEKGLYTEAETKTGTKREELNTGILPVVNVDMYSLSDNLYEYDIDQKELDDIVLEIAPKYIEDTLSEILPNVSVIAKSVYHPKQYNYSGDELEFDLVVDSNAYEELKEKTLNNPEFKQFLKDNYSSRSGFVSFMADDLDDFETQEEWKQMVQVIMFNIPEDKIELNNDQYITEFMDNVYMNYAPIDDEDDLTENKSLKTENKDEWVKNWEELNSMIEYYAEQEGFTLNDNDLYDITNNLAEQGILDTFDDFKADEEKVRDTIVTAIEQFPNEVEESTEDLDDDDDDFPYDNTTEKKCPKCGKTYTDFPALSRKDNKTYICPQCGGKEAMEDYLKSLKEDNSVDTEEFKVGDVVTDLIDNDLAVIEEIDDTRKSKYLLRFVQNPVMGEAFWYEPGRFEKVTDEETIKEALDIYNRNMKK